MAADSPFFRGEDVLLKFYQQVGGSIRPVLVQCKSWKVSENATEINEGVGGEKRDRLDKVTNYYDVSFDIYQSDVEFMNAYMAAQDADDNTQFPLKQSFAVLIKTPSGNYAYMCQEAKVGPWDQSMSSRSDAVMLSCKARFRFYKKIQAI